MESVGRTLFILGLLLIGAAAWIVAERLRVVEPMCLITDDIYQIGTEIRK